MSYRSDANTVRSYTTSSSTEAQVEDYERELERILQESLDSTQRSVQRLDNSEQLANTTAQNLLSQREKLERTEKNLDDIHQTTQETQRNLNSLKSLFGGYLRNRFSKPVAKPSPPKVPSSQSKDNLASTIEGNIDSMSNRLPDSSEPTLSAESRNAIKDTRFEAMDREIDDNIGSMAASLQRLRVMGTALGNEVDDQNQLINRIQDKADRNDTIVRRQDDQMKKLLGGFR